MMAEEPLVSDLNLDATGRLSPDGRYLAIVPNQYYVPNESPIWIYDRQSKQSVRAASVPPSSFLGLAWSKDDILYIDGVNLDNEAVRFAATMTQARQITAFPSDIAIDLNRKEASRPTGYANREVRVGSSVVRTYSPSGHGSVQLASETGDHKARIVADGSWELMSFVVDPKASLLFYPKWERGPGVGLGSIAIFNIKSDESKEVNLPVRAESLLDVVQTESGHLAAYVSISSCEPDAGSQEAKAQLPGNSRLRQQERQSRVCFAKLP